VVVNIHAVSGATSPDIDAKAETNVAAAELTRHATIIARTF